MITRRKMNIHTQQDGVQIKIVKDHFYFSGLGIKNIKQKNKLSD